MIRLIDGSDFRSAKARAAAFRNRLELVRARSSATTEAKLATSCSATASPKSRKLPTARSSARWSAGVLRDLSAECRNCVRLMTMGYFTFGLPASVQAL